MKLCENKYFFAAPYVLLKIVGSVFEMTDRSALADLIWRAPAQRVGLWEKFTANVGDSFNFHETYRYLK